MYNFNFNLKDPKAKETPINLVVRWKGNRLKYATNEKINPNYWNDKSQRAKLVKDFPLGSDLNNRLNEFEAMAKKAINKNQSITEITTSKEVRATLDQCFNRFETVTIPIDLSRFIDYFVIERTGAINPKTNRVYSKKTLYKYKEVKDMVNIIEPKIQINEIEMSFYHKYKGYLTNENKSINTIGKYITTLKTILHAARDKGIKLNENYNSRTFVSMSEEATDIYLNEHELNLLYKLDLSKKPSLERVRDLFLIGCWTGLRFSDFTNLSKDNLKENNYLEVMAYKTNKKVVIPLHPMVKNILNKYDYTPPKAISNQKFNEFIKEVGKLANINEPFTKKITKGHLLNRITKEKFNFMSSHTARRSFATNLYLNKFPSISIMAITGHKTETSFLKYIKVSSKEHATKILEHWNTQTKEIKMYG